MPADNRELTRIKNNQIVDATITAAKISNATITGGKLAPNLVYDGTLTVSGNLSVSGTTTTVDTVNTQIADPLIVLSRNAAGSAAVDAGLVIERGSDMNVVLIWDESTDEFAMAFSAEDGSNAGNNVTIDSYANLRVNQISGNTVSFTSITGNVTSTGTSSFSTATFSTVANVTASTASSSTTSGAVIVAGGAGIGGNVYVGNNIVANGNVSGANVTASTVTGNLVSSGTSNVSILNANGQVSFSANTASTSTSSGSLVVSGSQGGVGISGNLHVGGTANIGGNVVAANVSGSTVSGNVVSTGTSNFSILEANGQVRFSAEISSTDKDTGALVIASGGVGVEGNINVGGAVGITGNITAGNVSAATLTGNVVSNGTSTFSTATFSSLANVKSSTTSTSPDSGALKVLGGTGVGGNLNVGGTQSVFSGNSVSTSATTGVLLVSGTGGVGVEGNINAAGSTNRFTAETASSSHTTGAVVVSGGVGIGGDLNVNGSVVINQNLVVKGTTTTVNSVTTQLVDPIFQIGGGPDGASLANDDNKDRGIAFKYHDGSSQKTGFFGYDDSTGNFTYVANAAITDEVVTGDAGGFDIGTVTVKTTAASTSTDSGALQVWHGVGVGGNITVGGSKSSFVANTASSNTTSGALVVSGGVGIGGNLNVGGNISTTANLSVGNITAATVSGNLQSTGTSNLATVGISGTVTASGNTVSTTTSTGTIVVNNDGGVGVGGNINVGGSNSTFTAATVSTSTATGTVVVTGGTGIGGNLHVGGGANIGGNVGVVGNVTAGNVSGATLAGNVISTGTSSFSTATFSTLANVTTSADSTTTATGALIVAGGAGIGGNINVGGTKSTFGANTASTSNTSGVVVISGGAGVAGNLYVSNVYVSGNTLGTSDTNGNLNIQPNGTGLTIINTAGVDTDTAIRGLNDDNLLYVDAGNDNIGIGTASPNAGSKLHISATSSMIIPVGNSAQRPSPAAAGMVRFNTNFNEVEYYSGSEWQLAGQDFTVIATESFNGDGSTVTFTLSSTQTTAGCIVSVNGVVQKPVTAYGVSGTTLTFTQAPSNTDVIEVRKLTTTSSIPIQVKEGYANVAVIDNSILLKTGVSAETTRVTIANTGVITMSTGVASTSTGSGTLVVTGGVGVSGNVYAAKYYGDGSALTGVVSDNFSGGTVANATTFTANVASTSTSTGTVIVSGTQGGLGVGGNIYAGNISGTTLTGNVSSSGTSSFSTATFSTVANVTANTASTSTTTGALLVAGGVGVVGNVYAAKFYGDGTNLTGVGFSGGTVANATTFTANVASTSTTTGTVLVTGGVGVSGNVHVGSALVAQDVNSLSDARLKDNVEIIESALDKVLALRGVSYVMKATGHRSVGVIAQEIEQVLPEVVSTAADADGIKSVSYGNIVGVLIEAIKEQQRQIDELRAQLASK